MSDNIQVFEETVNLPVSLAPENVNQKLIELSQQSLRLETLLEDRRESNGRFNTEIKQVRGIVKELAESTNSGQQIRPVPIRIVKNFTAGTIEKERMDTGVVYEGPRPMTEEEAQMETVPGIAGEMGTEEAKPGKRGRKKDTANNGAATPEEGPDSQCICDGMEGAPPGTEWNCPTCGHRWMSKFNEMLPGYNDDPQPEMGA